MFGMIKSKESSLNQMLKVWTLLSKCVIIAQKSSKYTSSSPTRRRQPLILKNAVAINKGGGVNWKLEIKNVCNGYNTSINIIKSFLVFSKLSKWNIWSFQKVFSVIDFYCLGQ